jgi:hypothetical protein
MANAGLEEGMWSGVCIALLLTTTVKPLPLRHKLNYFSFCQTFEKLFIICAKIVINLIFHLLSSGSQTFRNSNLKLKKSSILDCSITFMRPCLLFYVPIKIKKPSAEVKISNLINYYKGTMIDIQLRYKEPKKCKNIKLSSNIARSTL